MLPSNFMEDLHIIYAELTMETMAIDSICWQVTVSCAVENPS